MKRSLSTLLFFFFASPLVMLAQENFYDYTAKTIKGESVKLSSFKGKKLLIVNTASDCKYTTHQYQLLNEIYQDYKDKNFVVLGFPSNNFGKEPGTNKEIEEFCDSQYMVSFPMMSKIAVQGEEVHPIYEWLTKKELNKVEDSEISWNFQKYMVDEEGNYVGMVAPFESPLSDKILDWIKE